MSERMSLFGQWMPKHLSRVTNYHILEMAQWRLTTGCPPSDLLKNISSNEEDKIHDHRTILRDRRKSIIQCVIDSCLAWTESLGRRPRAQNISIFRGSCPKFLSGETFQIASVKIPPCWETHFSWWVCPSTVYKQAPSSANCWGAHSLRDLRRPGGGGKRVH